MCIYVCIHIYIYIHKACVYICMYVCMYVCVYIYIYIYVHMYTRKVWLDNLRSPGSARAVRSGASPRARPRRCRASYAQEETNR